MRTKMTIGGWGEEQVRRVTVIRGHQNEKIEKEAAEVGGEAHGNKGRRGENEEWNWRGLR